MKLRHSNFAFVSAEVELMMALREQIGIYEEKLLKVSIHNFEKR